MLFNRLIYRFFRFKEMYYSLFPFLFLFLFQIVQAQTPIPPGVKIYGLQNNQSILTFRKSKIDLSSGLKVTNKFISRRNDGDTLVLPFFDDFTSAKVYPDQRLWTDSQVYINSHFPISPPSYGVATFDQLNAKGRPYTDLFSPIQFSSWDTLTSRPINLSFYKVGNQDLPYNVADSIYLSFFYQAGGLGDRPELADSFVVQFKLPSGLWRNIWSERVFGVNNFKQILIPINDPLYLYNGFQFRFVHFTYAMGNLNQVHLDYVRLNRNRSYTDTLISDVAIQSAPSSLLKDYAQMPYLHFLADTTNQKASSHRLNVRNNGAQVVNTQFAFDATAASSQLVSFPFSSSNRNIFSSSDSFESFSNFSFTELNPLTYVSIEKKYRINPLAGNTTPSIYNALGNNDEYISIQHFKNQYAYDDGTAEGGIGLSYEGLPPGKGSFALKYSLTKADTLAGLAIFFNRSMENISSRSFRLCVWRGLSEGISDDKPLYEFQVLAPPYTDSINGFHHFVFDTLIVLPKGDFFVGWTQNAVFNLNVGYDNNYRKGGIEQRNDNILFNLLGTWQRTDASIKGTPMIRPLIGAYSLYPLKVDNIEKANKVKHFICSPNPMEYFIQIRRVSTVENAQVTILDVHGRIIESHSMQVDELTLDTHGWKSGMYFIQIESKEGTQMEKIIKL